MTTSRLLNKAQIAGVAMSFGAALLGTTCPAPAGTLTYNWVGTVTDQIALDTPVSITANVGMFELHTPGGQVVDAWCVDLFHDLQGSGVYTVGRLTNDSYVPAPPNTLTPTQIGEIGALVGRGPGLVAAAGASGSDAAAGVQLAIWAIEYPSFTYSMPTAADSYYTKYLNDAENVWAPNFAYDALIGNSQGLGVNQNLVTAPEPSTWAMMLLGFAGLGYAALHEAGKTKVSIG
jgi:hypothetical protein